MADYIASVDAGNGTVKALGLKVGNKRFKRVNFPAVRAMASGDSLGLGETFEMQYETVQWGGHRYVVGDDVIRVTRRGLERHMGASRYGDEMHRFLTTYALAAMDFKGGDVALTLFAPPGLYNEAKQQITDRFADGADIQLSSDKGRRSFKWENISVWPEGIGAAAALIIDEQGNQVPNDIMRDQTVIIDIGAFTTDALSMTNGNFNPESLGTATWQNAGVETHVRRPILQDVHKLDNDFRVLTVDDVDAAIRTGLETGDYTLSSAGKEVDIQPLLDKWRMRYADWLANNICSGEFNDFLGVRSVILVGGGSALVQDHLMEMYGTKIVDLKDHPHTKNIHPVDLNAVGGLRLALMQTQG
jgi:hypothetical protein